MKKAPMFPAERNGEAAEELLSAEQVLISDWESRDFGGDVSVAPKDDILESMCVSSVFMISPLIFVIEMYLEMGSVFLGTYVGHDISPKGPKAEHQLPFDHDRVIQRIRCFMKKRDESGKKDDSFYVQGSNNFRLKACNCIKLKKTFAPPFGVGADGALAGIVETKSSQIKAGFKFDEGDGLYTLWVVDGSSDSKELYKEYVLSCIITLANFRKVLR